ncbi:hypothetical protein A2994_03830 [candidate division Kazan bacterium RIFCSPLOWO2_01_FULL_48_13]|uniref:Uncharacterized protein n=1 Tax=candidate division Kazan bacterium RIFCSPLOWO2_01_FULL_48_13 TaxID=1798539 RepID=A0A1F4PN74_UNCK3|nr:MAG: hypothetical protein A2994_03830 [candidate division Kazan bacterium RIFCSPLOWO2_01_FULL_48_13]
MSWHKLVNKVGSSLALVLWLMAERPLPDDGLGMNFRALWYALLLVHKETWGNQIRDQILSLLSRQAEGFDECKRVSHMAAAGSRVFDRAIAEMMAKADDFSKLTDIYNTVFETFGEEDKRIPVILKLMADLPNRDFKVTTEILKRTADEKISAKLRGELQLELRNFDELHNIIHLLPDNHPVAKEALIQASQLAETFDELRLLVHLGNADIKTDTLARMSRRSDVDLNGILNLFGYSNWKSDEECVNFIVQWIDQRTKEFSEWQPLSQHNYPTKLKKHILDKMLELADTLEDLRQCLQAYYSTSVYRDQVIQRMLEMI